MRIAIQGEAGSFHHAAARHWYDGEFEIIPCRTFHEVFDKLADGSANQAIVAIENSLYGSINEVYDLLKGSGNHIIGEVSERIHQQLIGLPGTKLSDIKTVISHPVALEQCGDFLRGKLPGADRREYYDTAAAVTYVHRQSAGDQAAIAGAWAAELAGLEILAEQIENDPNNYTRFVIISKEHRQIAGANKSSLVLQTSHKAGALYHALGVFTDAGINLTKLQSRPIPGKVWQYMFYVDVEAAGEKLAAVIQELEATDCTVTLLGEYKAAHTEYED